MQDPMRVAIRHRRAASAVDDSKLDGQVPAIQEHDPKGDLAPEVKEGGASELQSSEDPSALDAIIHGNDMGNPEHKPLERGLSVDPMGHEQAGIDPDFEAQALQGHEHDQERRPRTLGARVRASLQSKKGN